MIRPPGAAPVHAARHAPGGADTLDAYYAGRALAAPEAIATPLFTLDGTGGQVINTYYDIGLATPTITVNNKPIRVAFEVMLALKNGGTKFTGNVTTTIGLICVASSNAPDVGVEVFRAALKADQVTASNTNANQIFRGDAVSKSRLLTVGAGGLAAGNVVAGATYSFKLQIQTTSVTNLVTLVTSQGVTNSPAALILVEEK